MIPIKMSNNLPFSNGDCLIICGDSYAEWSSRYMPDWCRDIQPSGERDVVDPDDPSRFRVHEGIAFRNGQMRAFFDGLPVYCETGYGSARFTTDVAIPMMLMGGDVWMSLTPAEIITQSAGLELAKGHVLVGGCGMGWFASALAEMEHVSSVTVVDMNPIVLDWFGKPLVEKYGDKIQLRQGDAYEFANIFSEEYDSILFDIWKDWGEAYHDERFNRLKDIVSTSIPVWGWGDVGDKSMIICEAMRTLGVDLSGRDEELERIERDMKKQGELKC